MWKVEAQVKSEPPHEESETLDEQEILVGRFARRDIVCKCLFLLAYCSERRHVLRMLRR